jgi:hypothetical protein
VGTESVDYCREIERYLCRKNDGHLIRVVGPSFELVSGWAGRGVPLKIAFRGIDRSFERYYRKGPRRRPLRIEFCEADVLDAFDEWRRALGLPAGATHDNTPEGEETRRSRGPSLPEHLERAVIRLSDACAAGRVGAGANDVLDRLARALDEARGSTAGLRGDVRQALVDRLAALDDELLRVAAATLTQEVEDELRAEAEQELESYRTRLSADAYGQAHAAAMQRLLRERFRLPIIAFP